MSGTRFDIDLSMDGRYRSYVHDMDKALKRFEYSSDWTDLISYLTKLNKLISSNAKFGQIPKVVTISKRVAQCLHPALPFGVHLKALQSYKLCFEVIGSERLPQLLPLFSVGLFPLFPVAAINVKRDLLELFETHLLPVGENLAPCMPAFLLGIFPAMEEQGEFSERLQKLVENLEAAVGQQWLFSCLWTVVTTCPSVRLPALNYFLSRYDRKKPLDDQISLVGSSLDRMVSGLCFSAEDSVALVERAALDIISCVFPLDSGQLVRNESKRLLQSVVFCLLKRDMSLNRRLYTWLLGDSADASESAAYFEEHSKQLLCDTLLHLTLKSTQDEIVRVVRVISYLLQRDNVGYPVLERLLFPVLTKCQQYSTSTELQKGLQVLLDGIENGGYVWQQLDTALNSDFTETNSWRYIIGLAAFCLKYFSLTVHNSIRSYYIPNLLLSLVHRLKELVGSELSSVEISYALETAEILLSVVHQSPQITTDLDNSNLMEGSENLVVDSIGGYLDVLPVVLRIAEDDNDVTLMKSVCSFLCSLSDFPLYCRPSQLINEQSNCHTALPKWLVQLTRCTLNDNFEIVKHSMNALMHVQMLSTSVASQLVAFIKREREDTLSSTVSPTPGPGDPPPSSQQLICRESLLVRPLITPGQLTVMAKDKQMCVRICNRLWTAKEDIAESLKLFALLHTLDCAEVGSDAEEFLLLKLCSEDKNERLAACNWFAELWALLKMLNYRIDTATVVKPFYKAMLIMIGYLSESDGGLECERIIASDWLMSSLKNQDGAKLFESLLLLLAHPTTARLSLTHSEVWKVALKHQLDVFCLRTTSGGTYFHLLDYVASPEEWSQFRDGPLSENLFLTAEKTISISTYNDDDDSDEAEQIRLETEAFDQDLTIEEIVADVLYGIVDYISGVDTTLMPRKVMSYLHQTHNGGDTGLSPVMQEPSTKARRSSNSSLSPDTLHIPPLLAYVECFDTKQIAYVFRCLTNMLKYDPNSVLTNLVTSNMTNLRNGPLSTLLKRHLQSLNGGEFYDEINSSNITTNPLIKSGLLISVLLNLCQYYLRSYHLNNPDRPVQLVDLERHWALKDQCARFVQRLLNELTKLIIRSERGVAAHIQQIIQASRLQRLLIQLLLHSVNQFDSQSPPQPLNSRVALMTSVCQFNKVQPLMVSFQQAILDLILEMISLEFSLTVILRSSASDDDIQRHSSSGSIVMEQLSLSHLSPAHSSKIIPLVGQKIFLHTLLAGLKLQDDDVSTTLSSQQHRAWFRFVESCLPFLTTALPGLSLRLSSQLCKNIQQIVSLTKDGLDLNSRYNLGIYLVDVMNCLATIIHYCTLDTDWSKSKNSVNTTSSITGASTTPGKSVDIFSSFIRAISPAEAPVQTSRHGDNQMPLWRSDSLKTILASFPDVFFSIVQLWACVEKFNNENLLKKCVLDLLSPLVVNHPRDFISSMSLVWKNLSYSGKQIAYSNEQSQVAQLLDSISVLPLDSFFAAAGKTLKDPVLVKNIPIKDSYPITLFIIELSHGCVLQSNLVALTNSSAAFFKFINQALSLNLIAEAHFLLFRILTDYVAKRKLCDDSTLFKSFQDVSIKLIEHVLSNVKLQLQPSSWLNKSLALKPNLSYPDVQKSASFNSLAMSSREMDLSLQGEHLLAERLVPLLDCLHKNEDKLQPLLNNIWTSIMPFFKVRTSQNAPNFLACSQILAQFSQYPWSRNVWKKPVAESLNEPTFFRQSRGGLRHWLTIVDNLMTQDRQAFKEMLTGQPTSAANLFSSRDHENEMRVLFIRRLSFIVLSGQLDQYQPNLKDIQEKVVENLRLASVPQVVGAVFVFLRVLLVRISPEYMGGLWPIIVTEMISVLGEFEEQIVNVPGINVLLWLRCGVAER